MGAGLLGLPAVAQETDEPAASRASGLVFGVEQSFEFGRNLALAIPAEGDSAIAETFLSLSYFDSTALSRFALDLDGVIRFADTPDGSEGGFADPGARLSYTREGANAGLTFSAYAEQSDVAFLRDLSDFIGEDGEIDLPDDFGALGGTGDLNGYGAEVELELGRRNPLGFVLSAAYGVEDYNNTTSVSLFDETTARVGIETILRFSPVSTGTIALGYEEIDTDDTDETHRAITTLDLGYAHEVSARTRLTATLGFSQTDRETTAGASRDDTVTGTVGATYALPNGEIGGSIGVTRAGGDSGVIGSLNWQQALPTGSISAELTHEIDIATDGEAQPETALAVRYAHAVNAVSGIEFGLTHVIAGSTPTRNTISQTDLEVSYRRELTPDWGLSTGLRYQVRREATVGSAEAPFAFLTIGRQFDLR